VSPRNSGTTQLALLVLRVPRWLLPLRPCCVTHHQRTLDQLMVIVYAWSRPPAHVRSPAAAAVSSLAAGRSTAQVRAVRQDGNQTHGVKARDASAARQCEQSNNRWG
jgi:hypothetical protein